MNFIMRKDGLGMYFSKNNLEVGLICLEHNIPIYIDNAFDEFYIEPQYVYLVLSICCNHHTVTII